MTTAISVSRPVEVSIEAALPPAEGVGTATVAVVLVTWNRKSDVSEAIAALSRQEYPRGRMHVIVVDNNSTDGTTNLLVQRWRPEALVENPTQRAHEPRFEPALRVTEDGEANAGGFASLTIVHNHANMGGCGGFNTGLGYVAHAFAPQAGRAAPDFVWLVDDDIDLPKDALVQLVKAAATDPKIGLVGSRTVDLGNRRTTIESTIYYNRRIGEMADEPPPGHPQHDAHVQWVKEVGGPRGDNVYTGCREVDMVSACSMLARWSAVEQVGFWDYRYFIYCDDADWCLRFARAGYRVVLNLDAVVYHTPWNLKLTVSRLYYAHRNKLWMAQKSLDPGRLRPVVLRRMYATLRDSLRASLFRRLFHADVIRRTALDVARNRGGKLRGEGPTPEPVVECLRRAGALQHRKRIAVLCAPRDSVKWADELRRHVYSGLDAARGEEMPRWDYYVRNDIPDHLGLQEAPQTRPDRIVYSRNYRSRFFRRQLALLKRRPLVVVVFDQTTDFPAILGGWNLHVDSRRPTLGQLERDGWVRKLAFLFRWVPAAVRCLVFALTVRPYSSPTRYG